MDNPARNSDGFGCLLIAILFMLALSFVVGITRNTHDQDSRYEQLDRIEQKLDQLLETSEQ